jgi:hypothetical protein
MGPAQQTCRHCATSASHRFSSTGLDGTKCNLHAVIEQVQPDVVIADANCWGAMSLADAGDIPWPASRCDDPAVRHVPFSTDECCLGSTLCARPLGHRRSGRRRLDGVPVCVVPCARDQVEGPRCAVRAARTMADGARRVAGGFAATGGVTRAADLIEAHLHQRKALVPKVFRCSGALLSSRHWMRPLARSTASSCGYRVRLRTSTLR